MTKQQNLPNLKLLFDQLCENDSQLSKEQFKKLLNIIGLLNTEIDIRDQLYSFDDVINFLKTHAQCDPDTNTIKLIDLKKNINSSFDKDVSNYINTKYFNTDTKFINNSTVDKIMSGLRKT